MVAGRGWGAVSRLGGLDWVGLRRGWGLRRRGAGGGEGAAASPGPLPLGILAVPRPSPTLWSSMAAVHLLPARLTGYARSSSPQAAFAAARSNGPPSPRGLCRAPSQLSITGWSAQARPPRGRLGNVVLSQVSPRAGNTPPLPEAHW